MLGDIDGIPAATPSCGKAGDEDMERVEPCDSLFAIQQQVAHASTSIEQRYSRYRMSLSLNAKGSNGFDCQTKSWTSFNRLALVSE